MLGNSGPPTSLASPDYLGHRPKRHPDVMRIGRRPLICVGIALTVIAGVMTYTMVVKSMAAERLGKEDSNHEEPSINAIAFLDKKPSGGIITGDATADTSQIKVPTTAPALELTAPPKPQEDPDAQWQMQQEQQRLQLEQAKRNELKNALLADTGVYTNNQTNTAGEQLLRGSVRQDVDYTQPQPMSASIPQEPQASSYLAHTRVRPAAEYELKAGTVIPSVMLGGINSELPGQIMAQVSQNVFDSASGQYLLIPQGCKLVGSYDHQIVQGQNRVLVVWHRLIFPDASSVNLESMPGADASGYAGFKDKVANHFWQTFRNALMLSAITAGAQLSQPKAQTGSTYSSQQMIAASMGMQLNNLGMGTIARNLNQAPTVTIRPGYLFNVMITKDIILPPWQRPALACGTDR